MIEIAVLVFGIITGNVLVSIGWILLKAYNFIPTEYELISVASIMVLTIATKLLKIGGKS